MIYLKSEVKNPANTEAILSILEQLEIDVGEDPEKEHAKLLGKIKDLGEDGIYEELKGRK